MQPYGETAAFSLEKPRPKHSRNHLSVHGLGPHAFEGTSIHALLFSLFRGCLKRVRISSGALKTRLIRVILAKRTLPLSPYPFSRGSAQPWQRKKRWAFTIGPLKKKGGLRETSPHGLECKSHIAVLFALKQNCEPLLQHYRQTSQGTVSLSEL